MLRTKHFLCCTALGFFLTCQSQSSGADPRILDVFSDFSFMGTGPVKINGDGSIDVTTIPPHAESEQPLSTSVGMGVQYIFHHRAPVDNEAMALQHFQRKLSERGYRIVSAPASRGDLLYLFYGGPLFQIKCTDGKHDFLIFNSLHMNVKEGWTEHDFILVCTR